MRSFGAIVLGIVPILAVGPGGDVTARVAEHEGVKQQGVALQGVATQGFSIQGMSMQGMNIQGISSQGMSTQGIGTQGIATQGMTIQGIGIQGITTQGMNVQGLSHQGMGVQGLNLQGIHVQGLSNQGLSFQGMSVQGMSNQGMNFQGLNFQGLHMQGIASQGMHVQGFQVQGLNVQGMQVQGMGAQGISYQGMSYQGLNGQGFSVQGVNVRGLGLEGIALRGLSARKTQALAARPDARVGRENIALVSLEAGRFQARTSEGRTLRDDELVGLMLPFVTTGGDVAWARVAGTYADSRAADVRLLSLEMNGHNICGSPEGRGLFVPGVWDRTGARRDRVVTNGRGVDSTFSCTSGVVAKCVLWGYQPWSQGADLHQACTRMARADYCGDGVPHTREGTSIDMFDVGGIQSRVDAPGMSFEAAWGTDGAICVREPRYHTVGAAGQVVLPSCWAGKPHCDSWVEAVSIGGRLGNDSLHVDGTPEPARD